MSRHVLIAAVCGGWLAFGNWAAGQDQPAASDTLGQEALNDNVAAMLVKPTGGFNELITDIILDNIQHHYEKKDDWGQQKQIVSGLRVWRDGLKIKTKRRRKSVNHGSWKRYSIDLTDPEEEFQVKISNGFIVSCIVYY